MSQDRVFTKYGDTLNVMVKSIDKNEILYFDSKINKQLNLEIIKIYKIVWRSGKEFVTDQNYERDLVQRNK